MDQIDSMFTDLWDTDAIIFDIRNYPQGTMWYMIRYLFDSPIHNAKFTMPDIKYPGTLYWLSETVGFGDFSKTFTNPIILLFDEETQSQAEYTVMSLEQHPHAIKIGSQTAAADGNVSQIYLPGGIITLMTGLGVFYPDGTETQRIGIIPDIEVHPTIEGIREERDEVLEVALQQVIGTQIANRNHESSSFHLEQNYPNPFNPRTTISYQLPMTSQVKLTVYNLLGQEVATLVSERQPAGTYRAEWDASGMASGVYLYRFQAGMFVEIRKMILMQ